MTLNRWSEEDFESKFFDIRKHKPKSGQILAIYKAVAYFVDGWVKQNIISILKKNDMETVQKVMRNLVCATEEDSLRIPSEVAKDLSSGMSEEEVLKKEYKMIVEYSYWTERNNVPTDDPHWFVIDILNTDELNKLT